MKTPPIIIRHNFTPDAFMWLWAKYVVGFNERYHCTNCLRGRYSHRFSKARNLILANDTLITLDEHNTYQAIYICGVARRGYSGKKNYEHNVHIPIQPKAGVFSKYRFERWCVEVQNGAVCDIPSAQSLPPRLRRLPAAYTTCRIFRWASGFFRTSAS
jgi:hypothetical protein